MTAAAQITNPAQESSRAGKDVKQAITDRIIGMLERGEVDSTVRVSDRFCKNAFSFLSKVSAYPTNAKTEARYNGINFLLLTMTTMDEGYSTNKWLTFKQASELGGKVRKGERGTQGVYYSKHSSMKENETGETEETSYSFLKGFYLFNLDQIDGLDHLREVKGARDSVSSNAAIDSFIASTGAEIKHGTHVQPCYIPSADYISMPHQDIFATDEDYYATTLHELSHWTGHDSRMAREFGKRFKDHAYAVEELTAELCAAMLCGRFQIIDATVHSHVSYLASWLEALREDNGVIFAAASAASKAFDYLIPQH